MRQGGLGARVGAAVGWKRLLRYAPYRPCKKEKTTFGVAARWQIAALHRAGRQNATLHRQVALTVHAARPGVCSEVAAAERRAQEEARRRARMAQQQEAARRAAALRQQQQAEAEQRRRQEEAARLLLQSREDQMNVSCQHVVQPSKAAQPSSQR